MEYEAKYDSTLLRGVDDPFTPRPWNLQTELIALSGADKKLLDIGCGTSFKLLPLTNHFKKIFALDPSSSMLQASKHNISKHNITNIEIIEGKGERLPFDNDMFDVVSCMLSRWEISEIQRVLKPTGIAIIENIGCEDKKAFKMLFGKDEEGWRGQFINYHLNDYLYMHQTSLEEYFADVTIRNGYWNTHYTLEGIKELLHYTPSIRNYHEAQDDFSLQQAIDLFQTQHGITLQQNRILIYARSPIKNNFRSEKSAAKTKDVIL